MKPSKENIKEIILGNNAKFSFYRQGHMYYDVSWRDQLWRFPVPLEDIGDATLLVEHKAIELMRYIRIAIEQKTFVKAI